MASAAARALATLNGASEAPLWRQAGGPRAGRSLAPRPAEARVRASWRPKRLPAPSAAAKRRAGACCAELEGGSDGRRRTVAKHGLTGGASDGDEAVSLSASATLKRLQEQLRDATLLENYTEAAKIRDVMKSLEEHDPLLLVKKMLHAAIAEEKYEEAAMCRDELKRLAPLHADALIEESELKSCSDCTTQGVRVRVRSVYVKDRSQPSRQQFFFAYRIRISNEGSTTVQLINRHWIIADATGHTEEVRGPGVIGEQPILPPGSSFEYTSACPLRTASGTMSGEYEMVYINDSLSDPFLVKVGTFALSIDSDDHPE
eukprot:SM000127S26612  [mRNA]  locus=s127:75614:77943:- [translate_table: standard]